MKRRIRRLTKTNFANWLSAKRKREEVGVSGQCHDCPVARFIIAGSKDPSVDVLVSENIIRLTENGKYAHYTNLGCQIYRTGR